MRRSRQGLAVPRGGAHRRHASTPPPGTEETSIGTSDPAVVITPERVMTLTDGVVAIAMTLLVLDLNSANYQGSSAGSLWRALIHDDGRFIAFFIAFWVIARFWLIHHRVFRHITRHDDALAGRNFWFLFGISVLPFTTRLLGETNNNPLPVTLFSANLLLVSLALAWLSIGARRAGVAASMTDGREAVMARARTVTAPALLILPGALAWVIAPGTAQLLFLLMFGADLPGWLLLRRGQR